MLINRLITNICRINTNTTVKIPIRKYQTSNIYYNIKLIIYLNMSDI